MINLAVEVCCDQNDLQCELTKKFGVELAEEYMTNMGFFQGHGDVTVSVDYPMNVECPGEEAVRSFMDERKIDRIRFYEDH
jgi:hypothetical protein